MMRKTQCFFIVLMVSVLAVLCVGIGKTGDAMAADKTGGDIAKQIKALQTKIEALENKLGIQQDIEEIRRLQYVYGYYMDANLNNRVLDLFSDNPAVSAEMGGRGVYLGKEGVKKLFVGVHSGFGAGGYVPDGPIFGQFVAFNQMQGVIDVAPDRKTAKARFRAVLFIGGFQKYQRWQIGTYENEYIKENGKWKFLKFVYKQTITCPYEDCVKNPGWSAGPSTAMPPDKPATEYHPFPEAWVFPFHYPHPITGEWIPNYLDPQKYWCGPEPCK